MSFMYHWLLLVYYWFKFIRAKNISKKDISINNSIYWIMSESYLIFRTRRSSMKNVVKIMTLYFNLVVNTIWSIKMNLSLFLSFDFLIVLSNRIAYDKFVLVLFGNKLELSLLRRPKSVWNNLRCYILVSNNAIFCF